MLYISPEDFYNQIADFKKLSREAEIECAIKMHNGDAVAKEKLIDSYLPILGAFLKRWAIEGKPSMKLIYQGILVLEDSIQSFDFEKDDPQFAQFLEKKIKIMITQYISN